MSPTTGWASPDTARAYAAFARSHAMYRDTSHDLVQLAGIDEGAGVVLDLACGTGATTEQILPRLVAGARVIGVDGSPAMLAEARRAVDDPRVEWIERRLEEVDQVVEAHSVDVAVCNSAIWQCDMAATFAGVAAVLRTGGRFAFNIGRQFIAMPFTDEELHPGGPGLFELLEAFAVIDHSYVAPRAPLRRGSPLTVESVSSLLTEAGFDVAVVEERTYDDSFERQRDWLSIPIFTEQRWPGLTYEQRMDALEKAFARLDRSKGLPPARWMVFVAAAR